MTAGSPTAGSQMGSQRRQAVTDAGRPVATIGAGNRLIRRRPATVRGGPIAPEKRKVGGSTPPLTTHHHQRIYARVLPKCRRSNRLTAARSCRFQPSAARCGPMLGARRVHGPPRAVLLKGLRLRSNRCAAGRGLFVPKPTPFVVYLAKVPLGLQLGVWLRPPMSGIGTARCYSVGYSSAWWARYRITRRYCTRSAATSQRDASRAWRRSANGRRGRNSCTSRLRDRGAWGSLRPRAGRSPGPADWAVSGRTGTTCQPPQDHWGPT